MIDMISKVVAAVSLVISSFVIFKIILHDNKRKLNVKNMVLLVLMVVITNVVYAVDYSPFAPLIIYFSMIIIYKILFKLDISKTIITVGIVFILYFAADIIVGVLLSSIFGAIQMRENILIFIVSNLLVSLLAILIFLIPIVRTKIMLFVDKIEKNKYYDKILFFILIFIVLSLILYNISSAAKFSKGYVIDVIIMFIFFVLAFVFINEKNNREKLNDEYDRLMEYVENFEDWIEDEKLNSHEHKNQLAVIRGMVKTNKKAVEYIDNIIKDDIYVEDFWINEIKHLPTGGIKGLLYYKLILTKKENIDICLSVSRDTKNFIKDVESIELKNIYRLLGIYLDNAIEAAKESENKVISLEIYPMNSRLMIVISNTYKGNVDIKKIKSKGYTTKGSGHGNGLYYADKIVKKSAILESESSIINNYYIQKLMIIKKEI